MYKDWPIPGPRTVEWVCRFLLHLGRTPTEHHRTWKAFLKLQDSRGVETHRIGLEVLEVSGCYDQLNIANIAGLEKLLREAQLIEWQYAESARKAKDGDGDGGGKKSKGSGKGDVLVSGEQQLFTGKHKEYGNVMISPELFAYVAQEAEKEVSVMKQVRKAREERALARRDP